MKVGKHKDETRKWNLGELTIDETETYKCLGDLISNDGKNSKKSRTTQSQTILNNDHHQLNCWDWGTPTYRSLSHPSSVLEAEAEAEKEAAEAELSWWKRKRKRKQFLKIEWKRKRKLSRMILELHHKINLPALLINCESWNLNKGERNLLDRIEI